MEFTTKSAEPTTKSMEPNDPPPPYEENKSMKKDFNVRMDMFLAMIKKYNINPLFAKSLRKLEEYKIVYICDDSTSMQTPISDDSKNDNRDGKNNNRDGKNNNRDGKGKSKNIKDSKDNKNKKTITDKEIFARQKTRWNEAKEVILTTLDISTCLTETGIDIYFLNRPHLFNVHSKEVVEYCFATPPEGGTPLVETLQTVLTNISSIILEKKVLIVIVTDGEPYALDAKLNVIKSQVAEFTDLLINRHLRLLSVSSSLVSPSRIPISILACTDDEKTVAYLDDLDKKVPVLDVIDDYESERRQIILVQGKKFSFSHGDYVVKCLLSAIDPDIDSLDEKKIKNKDGKGKCVIL